jgi:ribosome-binding factor A
MKKTRRTVQVGDEIRRELSTILQREFSSADVGFLTVTGIELSTDLRYAKVFVSSLGKPTQQDAAIEKLTSNRGRIRHMLAERGFLRYTPELDFRFDHTGEKAASVEKILERVAPPQSEKKEDDDVEND